MNNVLIKYLYLGNVDLIKLNVSIIFLFKI